jgi:hypothetical protein
MTKNSNEILFDPGYSRCTAHIGKAFEELSQLLQSSKTLAQKKVHFKALFGRTVAAVEANVAFYLGCMLWAINLTTHKNTKIAQNPCLDDVTSKEASLHEIDALIHYIETGLNRDSKYYLGQSYTPNPAHIRILRVYREFLELNNGFCATRTTDDIILPKSLKVPKDEDLKEIVETIYDAIEKNNIMELMKFAPKVIAEETQC